MDRLIAAVVLGAFALHGAWYGVPLAIDAITQPWPTEITCAELAEGAEGDWVRVWNCEASLDHTTLTTGLSDRWVRSMSIGLRPRGQGGDPVVSVRTTRWVRAFSMTREDEALRLEAVAQPFTDDEPMSDGEIARLDELAAGQSAAWEEIQQAAAMGIEGRLSMGARGVTPTLQQGASPSWWAPLFYVVEMVVAGGLLWTVLLGRSLRIRVPRFGAR